MDEKSDRGRFVIIHDMDMIATKILKWGGVAGALWAAMAFGVRLKDVVEQNPALVKSVDGLGDRLTWDETDAKDKFDAIIQRLDRIEKKIDRQR